MWYTVTVTRHDVHPNDAQGGDTTPHEVISCTVEPPLAGNILRAVADDIAPTKPALRGAGRGLLTEGGDTR